MWLYCNSWLKGLQQQCGKTAKKMRKDCGDVAETVQKDYESSVDMVRTKCEVTAVLKYGMELVLRNLVVWAVLLRKGSRPLQLLIKNQQSMLKKGNNAQVMQETTVKTWFTSTMSIGKHVKCHLSLFPRSIISCLCTVPLFTRTIGFHTGTGISPHPEIYDVIISSTGLQHNNKVQHNYRLNCYSWIDSCP